jgi:hypothetical protein
MVVAGSAILLAVPRAVAPSTVPTPSIDRAALEATMLADDRLAIEAQTTTLDRDVRAVGDAFRRYNRVVYDGNMEKFSNARYAVAGATRKALEHGAKPLVILRAYHMSRFVEELHDWQGKDEPSDELIGLSGDFVEAVGRNAWCKSDGTLAVSDEVLRVLFKKRWNDIVGVRGPEFELTLDEDRLRHHFFIRHPFRLRRDFGPTANPNTARVLEKRRLNAIDKLAERDPEYPAMLARGVVHFQGGSYSQAASAFRSHLATSENGTYNLRVQNYLKASLDRANETGQ